MLCTIEPTEREQEIFDEVMEKINEMAISLANLPPADRLVWLKGHQYSYPLSFEREIDGTVYTVNAHFSKGAEIPKGKAKRILNQNIIL